MTGDVRPRRPTSLEIRGRRFDWGARTYVMAVVNASPDSFSGDAARGGEEAAIARGVAAAGAGADILDVGGESTRPGALPVPAAKEIERVVGVIRGLRAAVEVPISIDTSKAEVAAAALDAGADLVNDVRGLRADPGLAPLVASRGVPVVLMHNGSDRAAAEVDPTLGGHYPEARYDDLLADVRRELLQSVAIAVAAGVEEGRIVLDPGLGFGKSVVQSLELVDRLGELADLGFPLLVGPSRKSFIGRTLDLPVGDRLEGTLATVAVAIARGADIVRVHDVREAMRVTRMADAIVRRP